MKLSVTTTSTLFALLLHASCANAPATQARASTQAHGASNAPARAGGTVTAGSGGAAAGLPVSAYGEGLDLKFAGALEFSDNGILFVGDNHNGAIYAFDLGPTKAPKQVRQVSVGDIDTAIANTLGVVPAAIELNDLVVHPVSQEIFISVSRIGRTVSPAVVKIDQGGRLELLDLAKVPFTKQALAHYPDQKTTFRPRGVMGGPPAPRDLAKGNIKLASLAIMDMEFHNNQLFVAGVAYDNFLSTLRRIPYPFDGSQSATAVEMFHIVHDQYESRAPIRAMSVQKIDGKDQLVAAYTCSPLVLIPLEALVDGTKISGKTIGDMGNGQPLDMIPFKMGNQQMLFVTNNSRSPRVVPVDGLSGAKAVTDKDFERGPKLDVHPLMPYGPVGATVMFDGASLHIDLLGQQYFVSLTRDAYTGRLNLDSVMTMFPNRLHNLQAEADFPQFWEGKKTPPSRPAK